MCLCYSTLLSFSVVTTKALFCLSQIAGMCCGCRALVIQPWALKYRVADGMADWLILSSATSLSEIFRDTRAPVTCPASGSTFHPQHLQGQHVRSVCRHVRESSHLFAMVYAFVGVVYSPLALLRISVCGHCWTFSEAFALFIVLLQVNIIKRRPICSAYATSEHFEGHMASFGLIWPNCLQILLCLDTR